MVCHTAERKRMVVEARNVENRQIMLDKAMKKAKAGEERRRLREEREKQEAALALYEKVGGWCVVTWVCGVGAWWLEARVGVALMCGVCVACVCVCVPVMCVSTMWCVCVCMVT